MEKENSQIKPKEELIHTFDQTATSPVFTRKFLSLLLVVLLVGVGSGYVLSKNKTSKTPLTVGKSNSSTISRGTIVGSDDLETFKDTAEGKMKEGGVEGEGQFHLERPGGKSQYVYLTSSIVDLSSFVGKKVKVWGQTQKAQKAGWLMDVGRVEVLE